VQCPHQDLAANVKYARKLENLENLSREIAVLFLSMK
jgi:hypothetical protein